MILNMEGVLVFGMVIVMVIRTTSIAKKSARRNVFTHQAVVSNFLLILCMNHNHFYMLNFIVVEKKASKIELNNSKYSLFKYRGVPTSQIIRSLQPLQSCLVLWFSEKTMRSIHLRWLSRKSESIWNPRRLWKTLCGSR